MRKPIFLSRVYKCVTFSRSGRVLDGMLAEGLSKRCFWELESASCVPWLLLPFLAPTALCRASNGNEERKKFELPVVTFSSDCAGKMWRQSLWLWGGVCAKETCHS